jgi:hypothetical protein
LRALESAAAGWLIGSAASFGLAVVRLVWLDLSLVMILSVSAVGLAVGAVAGLLRPIRWLHAARAVDAHYQLKDRIVSALNFVDRPQADALHELAVSDAVQHLRQINPREVASLVWPRAASYATAALVVALSLVLVPRSDRAVEARAIDPIQSIVAQAKTLEATMIPELAELADRQQDPQLKQLVEQLKELAAEMQQPGVDVRVALEQLSQMQEAISQTQAEFNVEAVDAGLKQLGEALTPASALQAAAAALQQSRYSQAAEQLDQIDTAKLSIRETQTVGEELKKVAEQLQEEQLSQLSQAADQLAEGLKDQDQSRAEQAADKLAALVRSQAAKKTITQQLAGQLAMLGECKGACLGQTNGPGNMSGGDNVDKSQTATETWGYGASGQATSNEATRTDATLKRQQITGMQGDGPSEKEVTRSEEGQQQASREYREKYQEYRRTAEAVLDSEPLPLGHRRTIRRYFEAIRPTGTTAEAVDSTSDAAGQPADFTD